MSTPATSLPDSTDPALTPHAAPADAVALGLAVDPAVGLSSEEAAARLARDGPNELDPPEPPSLVHALLEAASEPFVILLAVAGVLAVLLGEVRDGVLVLLGLIPIVGADVVTEFRGEQALQELRRAAAPHAEVRRDGSSRQVLAREIVPGDIVLLRVGDVVPADLRLTRVDALTVDRSILTGESLPEEGRTAADPAEAVLAERRSMAYAGTSVVLGRGEGVVVATGAGTEVGRIASALGSRERARSPLQRELDRLVRILLGVAIALIAVTVGLGLLRGGTFGEALLAGISAAIAAIPEEPPVLLAVVLGLGAYRLLKRGVLVRRLNAQETLGAIDLIITDKTGTLTENRLSLDALLTPAGPVEDPSERDRLLVTALRAEQDAWVVEPGARRGSFTRALMAALGRDVALDPSDLIAARSPRDGQPYSLSRSRRGGSLEELAFGAPEAVLTLAGPTRAPAFDPWQRLVEGSASEGRRLLLLAAGDGAGAWQPLALLSFSDALRPGVPEALREATAAGIQTLVVTGDHPTTASAITRAAGLTGERVLTGSELDRLDDRQLAAALPSLHVVARATPAQKLRLVDAARAADRTVAVTGDGVNDAPALHRADVGVAMGSGTAVAREAADLVLGDDSFATLIEGLREGRRIVANVQKGLVFLISTHVALLGFILIATVVGYGQPLLPIQILWLELFIDLSTSVAFEREPEEADAMLRPPRPRSQPLLTGGLLFRIAGAGSITAFGALALMIWGGPDLDHARWLAFNTLVIGQLVRAYENRSLEHPASALPVNGFLAIACVAVALIQLTIPFVPPLAEAFRATPISGPEVALVALVAIGPAVGAEIIRRVRPGVWLA